MKMKIIGTVSNEEEKSKIMFTAKVFIVGQRAQVLAQESRRKNEKKNNNNKKKSK